MPSVESFRTIRLSAAEAWRWFCRFQSRRIVLLTLTGLCALLQVVVLALVASLLVLSVAKMRSAVHVTVASTASNQEVQDLLGNIRSLPSVADVALITREQAYTRAQAEQPEFTELLTKYGGGNPFPDTVAVLLTDPAYTSALADFLRQPAFKDIVDPASVVDAEESGQTFLSIQQATTWVNGFLLSFGGVLLLVILLQILSVLGPSSIPQPLLGAARRSLFLAGFIRTALLLVVCMVVASALLVCGLFTAILLMPDGAMLGWASLFVSQLLIDLPALLVLEGMTIIAVSIFIAVLLLPRDARPGYLSLR